MLLQPLTKNDSNLKDTFDIVSSIRQYLSCLKVISMFDFVANSANVPIKKTISISLDRIYNKKLKKTNLRKRKMKKLVLDLCTKTAFSFDNIYEQCSVDWAISGASIGNVIPK